jgi:hypothetical protein
MTDHPEKLAGILARRSEGNESAGSRAAR